jgi:hypothetical protein
MSERLAFVAMFSLMAMFVVALTVLAAKSGPNPLLVQRAPASSATLPAGTHDQQSSGKPRSDAGNHCRRAAAGDRHDRHGLCAGVSRL